ncbi:hypothetical protein DPMN_160629 [Dreissena polymorpha]|uniref:Uncharacterized protein n=1 Tax=Dreissena polymorpha TaxID=45954 RepID=A0A9D4EMK7_DREPO|nr:hypothetical protein DPMN_160629 [Dreissena polymorpha]
MFGMVADVPVTKKLLSSVRQAHKKYTDRKEAEKMETLMKERRIEEDKLNRQKEKESLEKELAKKRKINEEEKDLKTKEKDLHEDLQRANKIFEETNERLAAAIKAKDFKELSIAQSLQEVAKENIKKLTESIETCKDNRDEIAGKRKMMIDDCLSMQNTTLDKGQ